MERIEVKQLVKEIWKSGVYAHIEIDRQYDPSDIKQGIDEEFESYWAEKGVQLRDSIVGNS